MTGHGFINQGGTLGIDDMLYVNRVSWAHLLQSAARTLGLDEQTILTTEEVQALHGQRSPDGVITKLK